MAVFSLLQKYYQLIKPGRTIANGMTALAGFLLAANGHLAVGLLIATVGGICLIVASACAFNNYFDRDIDSDMERTRGRSLVKGDIPAWSAILYAAILGLAGFAVLASRTNAVTVWLGVIGMVDYLILYGLAKRRTIYSTLIGSICGATPIAAGYTAVTGRFDLGALLLFAIMIFWQMPHFYAIAIYRRQDYARAHLPIWSVERGVEATRRQIILFSLLFLFAVAALPLLGYASKSFLVVMGLLAAVWFIKAVRGSRGTNAEAWARGMFGFSLIVLLALSALLSINAWLP